MKNRFNRLTSKEWLPFQKSWFRYQSDEKLLEENVRFFCKAEVTDEVAAWYGVDSQFFDKVCLRNEIRSIPLEKVDEEVVQFAVVDLREEIKSIETVDEYFILRQRVGEMLQRVFKNIEYKRFVCVMLPNYQHQDKFLPYAWDMAKALSSVLSLKDEKIACLEERGRRNGTKSDYFVTPDDRFYCLYFKKDDLAQGVYYQGFESGLFEKTEQQKAGHPFINSLPGWFILKPQPRKKNEILHPAKYPEDLVNMFVGEFTIEGDVVFDPMAGTGSTVLGALKLNRKGYGTELSEFFAEIAQERCLAFIQNQYIPGENDPPSFGIMNKDARLITKDDIPEVDYLLTSPPYWDMLNMKGAENQAKRLKLGLQTNYSDSEKDLGNISDYDLFVKNLVSIYFSLVDLIKPGGYLTIVVKNIKKKGRNYPFAWDLAAQLQEKLILLPETFWCQDDISIAPYGYGNTWVSNTFHQYCLTFQKPLLKSI